MIPVCRKVSRQLLFKKETSEIYRKNLQAATYIYSKRNDDKNRQFSEELFERSSGSYCYLVKEICKRSSRSKYIK